jgi:hypothetical protein
MKRVPTPKLCAEIRAEVAQIQATRESVLRETLARLENIRTKIDRSETFHDEATVSSMVEATERRLAARPDSGLMNKPVAQINQEAHEALQEHFEEDRNELRGAPRAVIISSGNDASQPQSDR